MSLAPVDAGIAGTWARIQEITSPAQATTTAASSAPAAATPPASPGFAQALAAAQGTAASGTPAPAAAYYAPTASAVAGVYGTPYATAYGAYGTLPAGAVGAYGQGATGQHIAAIAQAEVGVAEAPPGSNDAPRIGVYRTATTGAVAGAPWCAYFTSWVARQAGVPIGDTGQGMGYVPDIKDWAERTGRWVPAASGAPAVGDLVVFDPGRDGTPDHIGVVTAVRPDGSFDTVEGNSSSAVSRRTYGAGGADGFVRLVQLGL